MAHFSTTPTVAGSDDTIRFGSMEFPALSPTGMWVPPIFEPSQAFCFGSLNFVADRLGVLHLREEAHVPAPVEGAPSIDSGTRDIDGAASALLSEQTLCSNFIVSNTRTGTYSSFNIPNRAPRETVSSTPQTPHDRFPYGLASSMDTYARGLRRVLAPFPLTSEFMGMAGHAPTASHKPLDGEGVSDDSSIGDVAPRHCPSQECAMADALGQSPVVVDSAQTHTSPYPRAEVKGPRMPPRGAVNRRF